MLNTCYKVGIIEIRNRVSRKEIILALFTVVPKVTPVLGYHKF